MNQRIALRTVFPGWRIVAASVGIHLLIAALLAQSMSAYFAVWTVEFGWSKTALAAAFSIQHVLTAIISPVQGWLLRRVGGRTVIGIGIVTMCGGFLAMSRMTSLSEFYVVFAILSLGYSLAGYFSLTAVIVNWFESSRARALALMQLGNSLGGLVLPAVAFLIVTIGWQKTSILSGVGILLLGMPLALKMWGKPQHLGLSPLRSDTSSVNGDSRVAQASSIAAASSKDFTLTEALRTRAFWLLTLGQALAVVVVGSLSVHLLIYLGEGLGYSLSQGSYVVALMTAATTIGLIGASFFGDRFDKRVVSILAMLGHAVAVLAVALMPTSLGVVLFAIVHGLAWGVRGPVMQALQADYFGPSAFAAILGWSYPIITAGRIVGPLIVGVFADARGSYVLGFGAIAGCAFLGALCFAIARDPRGGNRAMK